MSVGSFKFGYGDTQDPALLFGRVAFAFAGHLYASKRPDGCAGLQRSERAYDFVRNKFARHPRPALTSLLYHRSIYIYGHLYGLHQVMST